MKGTRPQRPTGSPPLAEAGGAQRSAELSPADTPSAGGWSRTAGRRTEGTRALADARRTAAASRAAPPLCGSGLAGRRRPSPAPLTHLRVQRHQLHERPGLLELGERHRGAAGPPALLRRSRPRRLPARGPRLCGPTPRAPEPLALWLGRPPPPPRLSHSGSLRHPAPPRPLATCAGAGPQKPRLSPRGAAFPARTPTPAAQEADPASTASPRPALGPAHRGPAVSALRCRVLCADHAGAPALQASPVPSDTNLPPAGGLAPSSYPLHTHSRVRSRRGLKEPGP